MCQNHYVTPLKLIFAEESLKITKAKPNVKSPQPQKESAKVANHSIEVDPSLGSDGNYTIHKAIV